MLNCSNCETHVNMSCIGKDMLLEFKLSTPVIEKHKDFNNVLLCKDTTHKGLGVFYDGTLMCVVGKNDGGSTYYQVPVSSIKQYKLSDTNF